MDPSEWRCACVDDMEGYNGMICRDLSNVMHQDRAGTRPSSAGVEPLRRPLAVTAGCWADTSASESACLLRGGHPTERAPGQLCGLALLTRWTCPHLDGRLLYSAVGRVSSPRRFAHASCRGKIPLEFLLLSLLMLVVVPSVRKRVSGNSVGPKKLKKARLPVHT